MTNEESGRPPIDAPLTDHRVWVNNQIDKVLECTRKVTVASNRIGVADKMDEVRAAIYNLHKVRDELVNAYMDGNKAERKTIEFKANEFDVKDDGDYVVCIDLNSRDTWSSGSPSFDVTIHHGRHKILSLRHLSANAIDIANVTYRSITGEGP